jgi:hypothetical protein
MFVPQMEPTSRKQRRDYIRAGKSANIGCVGAFEVVCAGGVQLDGQANRSGVRELLGMDTWNHAAKAPGGENCARLFHGEGPAIAVDIAEFG